MKEICHISKYWVIQSVKMFVFVGAFSILWPLFLQFFFQDAGNGNMVDSCYNMIMIIYAMFIPMGVVRNGASLVVSLGGTRKDIFVGSVISDIVFLILSVIGYGVINYVAQGKIPTQQMLVFTGIFLIVQGMGYLIGKMVIVFGRKIVVTIIMCVGGAMAFVTVRVIQSGRILSENELSSTLLIWLLAIGVVVNIVGKIVGYFIINKTEVLA